MLFHTNYALLQGLPKRVLCTEVGNSGVILVHAINDHAEDRRINSVSFHGIAYAIHVPVAIAISKSTSQEGRQINDLLLAF